MSAATGSTSSTFKSSMGGGFQHISTLDWKFAAIQQIGLIISKKYKTVEQSFDDASAHSDKVDVIKFDAWLNKTEALQGFNITKQLM